jgi:HTH DNA binding domain
LSSAVLETSSHLPALIDLVLARPLVSTTLIADELAISARAAQNLVGELGLRELTGRGRYRAWAI